MTAPAGLRISRAARADIVAILTESARRHGTDAQDRYRALIAATLARIARDPSGPSSVARDMTMAGARSLHLRHARRESRIVPVATPVHEIYYRPDPPGRIEILRVLHERMDPGRHLGGDEDGA
ncbi:MAG: type II toxin-antitoxin system RelE/ParE family toxin [Tagaea sp.]|nr:type II toxin-antitoxin system RelE/ParE family toxin [Tagaea sp.]